ncbi:hypothetical protein MTY_2530 [Moorella thermoacetica Y72]|uniref:Uncharacterized protein n=1 Tax=Moorella thermoacetica Y72 TaxID=1325331 RepID=A0A0S6UEH0_NEOTH|nr:hypothetical protein MTY_2530 [Moorella thermoacetica Y72]
MARNRLPVEQKTVILRTLVVLPVQRQAMGRVVQINRVN